MALQTQFNQYWQTQFPDLQPGNCSLLLAVSGGIDSVVLADLVFNAGFSFRLAHCNFRLRGEESDRDEGFVRELAQRYGVPVEVRSFATTEFAESNKLSIQEAARKLRYEWFADLVQDQPRQFLLTAHHADDNVETVLFNIFRGTGISGLHGILPRQQRVIRPLLFASRADIVAYAKEKKLQWVEDSSNESTKYTRNYIRHELLPLIRQVFPGVMSNLNESISRWRDAESLYLQAVAAHKKKLCEIKGNEIQIPVLKLRQTTALRSVVYEIIRDFGFTSSQTDEVIGLLESESGRFVASDTHRVLRNRNWLIIAPLATEEARHILIESGEGKVVFPGGTMRIESTDRTEISSAAGIALLDASKLRFPLLLRRWKQGDYFYPLGMSKKKKLSRFLIDQKVPMTQKENTWVVESDKKILWVVGHRIDNRFKILPSTKQVLKLSLV